MIPMIEEKYFLLADSSGFGPNKSENDIAITCPLCKEGNSYGRKKRCHLFIKQGMDEPMVHCFNCDFKGNMFTFLKAVNLNLYENYKQEKRAQYLQNLKTSLKKQISTPEPHNDKDMESSILYTPENPIPMIKGSVLSSFEPFVLFDKPNEFIPAIGTPAQNYLASRGLESDIYNFFFAENDVILNGKRHKVKGSVIIPLQKDGKWYGFQARSLKSKWFHTYLPEENKGWKVWNFFDVDKTKEVYVFESVFDALSSGLPKNQIIAGLGADIPDNILEMLSDPIFCYDNFRVDQKAKEKMEEYSKKYKIFIWPKSITVKDFNDLIKNRILTKKEISKMIEENIEKGFLARVKLKCA